MSEPVFPKLRRFQVFDTDSRDEIRVAMIARFGASDFSQRQDGEAIRGIGAHLRLKTAELCYGSFSAEVSVEFPTSRFVRQPFALSGSGLITFSRSQFQFHVNENETGVVPAGTDFCYDQGRGFSQIILGLDAAALEVKLAALIGRPIGRNLEFVVPATFQDPKQARLRRVVEVIVSEIDREDAIWPEVAFADFEQLLIMSFLTSHAHNFSHLLEATPPSAARWQVAVVEEYIDTNWNRPITIEQMAQATGVGVRSMFKTFSEARGYSPMAFVKRVRLEHARRMLQAPDETTSVAAVSAFCGFHHTGHFARYYREAFGELPHATLFKANATRRRKIE
jgi:AraC-like DNA-binding protein